jgi:CBS domain-containing protein
MRSSAIGTFVGAVPGLGATVATWAERAVTIRIVGESEGRRLNREYRNKNGATNVLSFETGDIILCHPVIKREARAQGKGPDTPVREVMSKEIKYCYEDEDLEHVAENMGELQVRRLPVVNREKRLVGIVSLGDLSKGENAAATGQTVAEITRPGGAHSQKSESGQKGRSKRA